MENEFSAEISDTVEIVKKSWRLYMKRWWIFLPIGVLLAGVSELSNYLTVSLKNNFSIFFIFNLLITSWITMLLLKIALEMNGEAPTDRKDQPMDFVSKYPSFIAAMLMSSVLIVGGFFCLIIPGIYLMTTLYFADVFVMKGEKLSIEALKKSMEFVKGIFRRVLLCIILVVCLLMIPLVLAQMLESHQPSAAKIISIVVSIILVPFSSFTKVVIFQEMREIKKNLVEE